jgi:hypothetical protein
MKSLPKGLTSGNGVKKDKCWPVIGPFLKKKLKKINWYNLFFQSFFLWGDHTGYQYQY